MANAMTQYIIQDPHKQLVDPSKELPKENQECVVWFDGYKAPVCCFYADKHWYQLHIAKRSLNINLIEARVLWWMPIPRTYVKRTE